MLPTPVMVLRLGTTEIILMHEKNVQAFAPHYRKVSKKSGKEKIYRLYNSFVYALFLFVAT
jgi:hypothetical protein